MYKSIAGVMVSAAALTIASTLYAANVDVKTGLWKTTSTTTRNGQSLPARSQTRCMTQKDVDDLQKTFAEQRGNDQCKRTDFSETKSTVHWKFECSGQFQMVANGDLKFDSPSHFTGQMVAKGNVMGQEINNVTKMEGERVGACTGNANAAE